MTLPPTVTAFLLHDEFSPRNRPLNSTNNFTFKGSGVFPWESDSIGCTSIKEMSFVFEQSTFGVPLFHISRFINAYRENECHGFRDVRH